MKLRNWQQECITQALKHFESNSHFFCQATPGAGKTTMATELAAELYKGEKVDFVLCFSPSVSVSNGFHAALSKRFDRRFDGKVGAIGGTYTYQSMAYLNDEFWEIFDHHKVLVIFDEIHHCSGRTEEDSNSWGEKILQHVKNKATYTLALSGTPWRSDNTAIVLSKETPPIECDYQYSLLNAVQDNVCRKPKVVLIDNEKLILNTNKIKSKQFTSIGNLLDEPNIKYSLILNDPKAILHLLKMGCEKLEAIRKENRNAGGLIVASSILHAETILKVLTQELGQSAVLVSYKIPNAHQVIDSFRESGIEWIVSVGMISEGTDIPRLQVCCHLSNIKTELYFRQVLGRILRVNDAPNQKAWLYTFAEHKLMEYARQIEKDIPDSYLLINSICKNEGKKIGNNNPLTYALLNNGLLNEIPSISFDQGVETNSTKNNDSEFIEIDLLGSYREEIISIFESPFY
ncbi:MAG: DEAD/DEAH box helicase family protein [Oleispira sp.]|nr:DEAD/DEAH box helicase family protein [Oleispira sp.]MBL4880206.1 DEAD/DEAH box helicase family protein [Oleispira sp.]